MPDATRESPLHSRHVAAGARMTAFAGWTLPVQFSGIVEEHLAVRKASGVFDISHMGHFTLLGPGAARWLDGVLANRVAALGVGRGQYSFLLNDRGGVIDDLIVYRTGAEAYHLIVNAARRAEDAAWLLAHGGADAGFADASEEWGALAWQGPEAVGLLRRVFGRIAAPARFGIGRFARGAVEGWLARTGYTGEDGVEIVAPRGALGEIWDAVVAAGAARCGLGARDSLRLEASYPLNGSDLGPDRTPLAAGLGFAVDLEKGEFIGREALLRERAEGAREKLVAVTAAPGQAPPRAHYGLHFEGRHVGEITSGSLTPTLGCGVGLAWVEAGVAKAGTQLEMEVRGRRVPVVIRKRPLYKGAGL